MEDSFSCLNKTKGNLTIQGLPFQSMKEYALGKKYELSLVFVSPKESQKLNYAYRKKDKPTNVLSFPLEKNSGEIVICPAYAKKEAKKFDREFRNYLQFLFIHGLIHLKGFDHGSRMEDEEEKIRLKFRI